MRIRRTNWWPGPWSSPPRGRLRSRPGPTGRQPAEFVAYLNARYAWGTEHTMPPRWAAHGALVEELTTLMWARWSAFEGPAATPEAAQTWHTYYLPGFLGPAEPPGSGDRPSRSTGRGATSPSDSGPPRRATLCRLKVDGLGGAPLSRCPSRPACSQAHSHHWAALAKLGPSRPEETTVELLARVVARHSPQATVAVIAAGRHQTGDDRPGAPQAGPPRLPQRAGPGARRSLRMYKRQGLVDAGYRADVGIAAEVDTSQAVLLLVNGHSFIQARRPGSGA